MRCRRLACDWYGRHESRRVDNQLRGRAGRQGDPLHPFFLSPGDNLAHIRWDRVAGLMNAFRGGR